MAMQRQLIDLIDEEITLIAVPATGVEGAVRPLAAALEAYGSVEEGFADDVLEREAVFPTGLPTEPLPVAIPHADPDHVLSSAVAIATLKEPVSFGQMGSGGEERVDAEIVFLLAVKETEKQVTLIQQLMSLLQNPGVLAQIHGATTAQQIVSILREEET
jgi:PTS system galactitol-specific IIA component